MGVDFKCDPETGDYVIITSGNIKDTIKATRFESDQFATGAGGKKIKTANAGDLMENAEERRIAACFDDANKQGGKYREVAGKNLETLKAEAIARHNKALAELEAKFKDSPQPVFAPVKLV